jgi:hypothetical protein
MSVTSDLPSDFRRGMFVRFGEHGRFLFGACWVLTKINAGLIVGFFQRQGKPEEASLGVVVFHADFTPMSINGHFAEGQAKTGCINPAVCFSFQLHELVEDCLAGVRRHAGTLVLYEKPDVGSTQVGKTYGDGFARRRILDGVGHKVL